MATSSQNINLQFSTAINDKTVDESRDFNKLIAAENTQFIYDGSLEVSQGYDKLDGVLEDPLQYIYPFQGSFAAASNSKLYAYDTEFQRFTEMGASATLGVETNVVYKPTSSTLIQQNMVRLLNTDIYCITWVDPLSTTAWFSVYNLKTKTFIVLPQALETNYTSIKAVALPRINSFLLVTYSQTLDRLSGRKYDLNSRTLGSEVTYCYEIRLKSNNIPLWDICPYLGEAGATVAYIDNITALVKAFNITEDNVIGNGSNGAYAPATFSETANEVVAINRIGTSLFIAWNQKYNLPESLHIGVYSSSFIPKTTHTITSSVGLPIEIGKISAVTAGVVGDTVVAFFDTVETTDKSSGKLYKAVTGLLDNSLAVSKLQWGCFLASKAFTNSAGLPTVMAIHKSTEQSAYFAIDADRNINAQFQVGTAGDADVSGDLWGITEACDDGKSVHIATLVKGKLSSQSGVFYSLSGIGLTTLYKNTPITSIEFGGGLYTSGGMPRYYDGVHIREAGFTIYPEGLEIRETVSYIGGIEPGTYSYKATFEYYDNKGKIFESKTSTAISTVIPTGSQTYKTVVRVPINLVTEKPKIIVSLYRTLNGGTVFYKLPTSPLSTLIVDPLETQFVDIDDVFTDNELKSNQTLYITGGILDNANFPSCKIIRNLNGRIWFGGCETPSKLYYSKTSNLFQALQVASELYYDTLEGGGVQALFEFNSSVVVAKSEGIFIVTGNPVLNNLQGGSLQPIKSIAANITALNQQGICSSQFGIFFVSRSGIKLFTSAGIQNIGDPISTKLVPEEITKITYNERRQHLRVFTLDTCWVRDMGQNTWFNWSNWAAKDMTEVEGLDHFIKPDGAVRKETDSPTIDNVAISWKIRSGWVTTYEMGRVITIWPRFRYYSSQSIQINLYYDYEPNYFDSFTIDTKKIVNSSSVYGIEDVYGDEVLYGGGYNNDLAIEVQPTRQECRAISLEFIIYNNGDPLGRGVGLLGVTLEVEGTATRIQVPASKAIRED
jgi:hypothetical protein